MGFQAFLRFVLRNTRYIEIPLTSTRYRSMKCYSYGPPDPFVLGVSLRGGAYLSHGSALHLHGLGPPTKRIYVNREQHPKPRPDSAPTQEAIDRSFANNPRISNYVLKWKRYSFVMLSGKNTGRLQVVALTTPGGDTVEATGLERTLIDAAVRPVYCGGVQQVANAYREAKPRVIAGTLLNTLEKLEHVYPYHQAIGFYMQRADYDDADVEGFRALGTPFKFYLENKPRSPKYSPEWHVHYPRNLI